MSELLDLYHKFLAIFPSFMQPIISLILGVLLVISIIQTLRRQWIWLIGLAVLLPSSVPILKSVWATMFSLIKILFGIN